MSNRRSKNEWLHEAFSRSAVRRFCVVIEGQCPFLSLRWTLERRAAYPSGMLTDHCDDCGKEARLVRQIIEYVRVTKTGEAVDGKNLAATKTTFVYECSECGRQKTQDVVYPD
jgi:hypothetical protein